MGRRRKYKSLKRVRKWNRINNVGRLKKLLFLWMQDVKSWGEVVRDDIVRIEGAVGLSTGDTGDPPPAPRSK